MKNPIQMLKWMIWGYPSLWKPPYSEKKNPKLIHIWKTPQTHPKTHAARLHRELLMGALCGKETEAHVLQLSCRPGVHELRLGLGSDSRISRGWYGILEPQKCPVAGG